MNTLRHERGVYRGGCSDHQPAQEELPQHRDPPTRRVSGTRPEIPAPIVAALERPPLAGSGPSVAMFGGSRKMRTGANRCCLEDALDWHEERLDRHRLGDEVLGDHIAHERFEGRAVGLDAVGPGIAVEDLIDLLEVGE
jgi:hypothetical protein